MERLAERGGLSPAETLIAHRDLALFSPAGTAILHREAGEEKAYRDLMEAIAAYA